MKTKTGVWFSFLLSFLLIAPTSYSRLEAGVKAKPNRNPEWAEYIELEGAGNLHKVDDNLYRSEQPTAEGMKNLEKLGIKMVINLRSFHDDKDKIQDTNLLYKRQPMDTWEIKDDDIVQIMRIIEKKDEGP
ncbi:hypothetical protein KKA14_07180, partial [bacterium]|nr:hypothetical protein [bacterium]